MSEEQAFDFSAEIDPDYVKQTVNEPDHKPARIMTERAWFMSLLLPVLSILAGAFVVVVSLGGSPPFIFTAILGLVCGGIVPTVMIVRGRLDLSRFFLGKMIIIAASVAILILLNDFWADMGGWTYVITVLLAEIIFAAVQKTNVKTKICLTLSSLAWGLLGFFLDFAFGYIFW